MEIFGTALVLAAIVIWIQYVTSMFERANEEQEKRKWRRFKDTNKCELIGIDETGWRGKKYIWKTKDGVIIKNYFKK